MFARLASRRFPLSKCMRSGRLWRNASQKANAPKREQKDSSLTLAIVMGISGPVCYCVYSYATDKLFHENMDEQYVYQWPWLYNHMNKWFPIKLDSPFATRRLNVPMELKEVLAEVFTEFDLALEDGMKRSEAVEFMEVLLEKPVSKKLVKSLEEGEYLNKCMQTVRRPDLKATPGLDCVMSVDEFIAFAGAVLVSLTFSISTLCLKVRVARDEYASLKNLHIKSSANQENAGEETIAPDYTSQGMPYVRMDINSRYPMDSEVISKFNAKKKAEEDRNERMSELQTSIGVMQWELDQMYAELKELRNEKAGSEGSVAYIRELNMDIQSVRKQIAEAKAELAKL